MNLPPLPPELESFVTGMLNACVDEVIKLAYNSGQVPKSFTFGTTIRERARERLKEVLIGQVLTSIMDDIESGNINTSIIIDMRKEMRKTNKIFAFCFGYMLSYYDTERDK